MLRSLFAGISGLRSNQTMLDVVGNNIANANTIGFKSSNVVFQDTLAQMLTSGNGAGPMDANGDPTAGGSNPIQVGLGVSVGGTTTNFGQGSPQVTGRATDMMIVGDGFFAVRRGQDELYTRAGAFTLDESGALVTLDGDLVLGVNGQPTGTAPAITYTLDDAPLTDPNTPVDDLDPVVVDLSNVDSFSIGADGVVTGIINGSKQELARIAVVDFANPEGLEKVGDTAFREGANSGAPQVAGPGGVGVGQLRTSALEMSNVDLAAEFTNLIIAQRGFQATSRVITTSDSVLEELVNLKR
jgi:flagellar hook protein FlgE